MGFGPQKRLNALHKHSQKQCNDSIVALNKFLLQTGKQLMTNPIIAELTRGPIIESRHTGAYMVCDAKGRTLVGGGDIAAPIYSRSAIKAFQCLPVIESGAADHFGLNEEEIALCCASHDGESEHVRVARSILAKIGVSEVCYECGAYWPTSRSAAYQLVREGKEGEQVHNNCSGKHAGMLALAKHLNVSIKDYVKPDHPVQRAIARSMGEICEIDLTKAEMGIDGCSVPTWAMPLSNTAMGFARLPQSLAGQRIIAAARIHPFMIAGTARFDTKIMTAVPRLFIKYGAEGVYCGSIPHAGLGFAMKCDDGAPRAIEVAAAGMLSRLDVWTMEEIQALKTFQEQPLKNWRKMDVGMIRSSL
jgi:L-asparaginase II